MILNIDEIKEVIRYIEKSDYNILFFMFIDIETYLNNKINSDKINFVYDFQQGFDVSFV